MDITKAFTNSHRIIIWNRIQKYNWIRTRTESRSDTRPTETQVRSTTNRNIGKKHGQHIWKVRNMCGETLCYLSKTRPTEIQVENTDNIIIIYIYTTPANEFKGCLHPWRYMVSPTRDWHLRAHEGQAYWVNVCSPNILWTVRRTMVRFLIELLVHRTWFRQSKLYFVLIWLVMRCGKLRSELAADSVIENVG